MSNELEGLWIQTFASHYVPWWEPDPAWVWRLRGGLAQPDTGWLWWLAMPTLFRGPRVNWGQRELKAAASRAMRVMSYLYARLSTISMRRLGRRRFWSTTLSPFIKPIHQCCSRLNWSTTSALMSLGSRGTILFTGGGLALEPEPGASSLAIGKAAIRNLAFSLYRELAPFHIHVATVTICGYVRDGTKFSPGSIADSFFHLHQQSEGQWEREFVYQ